MPKKQKKSVPADHQYVRLTVQLSLAAYDAVNQLQQKHRVQRGKAIPKWRVLDAAVMHYAQAKGIQTKAG